MKQKDDWLGLTDEAVSLSRADECYVSIEAFTQEVTRFSGSQIHQNMEEENLRIKFLSAFGNKVGAVSWEGNVLKKPVMKRLVRTSEEIARHLPENPHFPSFAPARKIPVRHLGNKDLWKWDKQKRTETVKLFIQTAQENHMDCAGHIMRTYHQYCIATSHQLRLYSDSLSLHILMLSYSSDASGYAEGTYYNAKDFIAEEFASESVQKCLLSCAPKEIPAGDYPVLLEPYAVADILGFFAWLGFNARMHLEKKSFLLGLEGKKVFSDRLTIVDDPFSDKNPGYPFDGEGEEKQKWILVDRGVFVQPVYDRTTAKMANTSSTGHGLPPPNEWGPFPLNLILLPGQESSQQLLKKMTRGLLVTRFHYSNVVDDKKGIITGMTRDGTFLVEGGEIVSGVKNLRFTQGLQEALAQVDGVGNKLKLSGEFFSVASPAILLPSFHFTSGTLF